MSKEKILRSNGYKYDKIHTIYINASDKKVFSEEAVSDHDENWLYQKIHKDNDGKWEFYFNDSIKESTRQEILSNIT